MSKTKQKRQIPSRYRMVTVALMPLLLSACASINHDRLNDDQAQIVRGPSVTDNRTPLADAFQCMSNSIVQQGGKPLAITVGNVKDYTGKFSEVDGGNPITQGGALMVISALGKLGQAVELRERYDTQIAEIELAYLNKRYLGDGETHRVKQNGNGVAEVPWLPYVGGSIIKSDYYIVGGITELNYNIQSGGAELFIKGTGGKGRVFVVNVAVDLRIVNTETLKVEKTISLQKQLVGYEVAASIFRFFGDILVDFNAGTKSQEPMQLGVRTALELGVLDLVGHVTDTNHVPCLGSYGSGRKHSNAGRTVEDQSQQSAEIAVAEADVAPTVVMQPETQTRVAVTQTASVSAPRQPVDPMTAPLIPLAAEVEDISADPTRVSTEQLLGAEVDYLLLLEERVELPTQRLKPYPAISGGS